jgi:hypothetical protein
MFIRYVAVATRHLVSDESANPLRQFRRIRMSRDVHDRFCEGPEKRLLRATRADPTGRIPASGCGGRVQTRLAIRGANWSIFFRKFE